MSVADALWVGAIRGSGYVWLEKLKRLLLPSGCEMSGCEMLADGIPDVKCRSDWILPRVDWAMSQGGPSACARCRDPSPGWHGVRMDIRINSIRIPQEDMWRAPLSRLSQGEAHDTCEHHTRTISYPIRICCLDHWLNVSKPCYNPRSAAILSRRPVRTSFTMDS